MGQRHSKCAIQHSSGGHKSSILSHAPNARDLQEIPERNAFRLVLAALRHECHAWSDISDRDSAGRSLDD
jgi:hypothetical protein